MQSLHEAGGSHPIVEKLNNLKGLGWAFKLKEGEMGRMARQFFFGRDDERGIRRCSWCSEPNLERHERRQRRGRRHVTHLFPFPCRHAATHPRCCSGTLYISNRPPSTPKTSIGSITRLADPAIPSLLQEGLPTRRDSRAHLRSRSAARFRPHAVQTILQFSLHIVQ